jgi:RNA polymerase sigma-70 factor, ECF subfamily
MQTVNPGRLFPSNWFLFRSRAYKTGNKIPAEAVFHMGSGITGKGTDVFDLDSQERARFEQLVLPHLDAAFNLARWLLRNRTDAQDVAQEAMLRAFRFFRGFNGGDARAWLLQIVRNTCFTWLEKHRSGDLMTEFDEEIHLKPSLSPESQAIASDNRERLTRALEDLPPRFREILVLRELEGCSYKEIATITSMPIGTVMSSLARARQRLQRTLAQSAPAKKQEASHEL